MFFPRAFTALSTSLASIPLLATCSLPTLNALVSESNADATSLTEGSEFYGFQLEEAGYLDSRGLPASCINALTQMIYCDAYVYDFGGEPRWRGYVDTNETTYESVCDASCGASIRSYWDGIVEECAGHNFSSNTTITIGAGRLWEAWNETCYYDPDSGRNCNEIINDFAEVDDIEHMPYDEICSYCQVEHYRMMQNSPYSAYDEFFQRELQKINEKCGLDIPTDISFPPEPPRALDLGCFYEAYKIQEGDTCASVAEKYNLTAEDIRASYAMRYAAEKWPADCDNFRAGLVVCIPRAAGEDEAALADGELSSSADVEPSISPLTSTPQVSSSSTKTASTTGIPVNSSQSTGIISMATSESSGTIGAKPATQTAGSSADATPSVSVDHVSAASMIGFGRSQIIAVAAALMLCHITVCGPAARWIEGAQLAREIGCTVRSVPLFAIFHQAGASGNASRTIWSKRGRKVAKQDDWYGSDGLPEPSQWAFDRKDSPSISGKQKIPSDRRYPPHGTSRPLYSRIYSRDM
ncbi:hypothetical protein M436DRAFT_63980 [Aureobasidium namibiae CBS 147.97]|uniref:LysM domain-containing protein n=1 Tax=Aureobasidium namibiae CBS 147.97 TaxID=1043004 RepID=A0A074WSQ6_9PEZI|nr:uncharacterized protein M436DRAFT_63980 [Aureobasidium namibiae CBS 147.97]KEQ72802.1 hypothetical protein M436DRAFT_63980 [Aureobasidium namibiae CBS 147.97]